MTKFTDRYIQGLKPTEKMYQVREGHGFGMRILPSGLKIWIYTYTWGSRRRQLNLGHYPPVSLADARRKYLDAAGLVANDIDPQAEPESPQPEPEPEAMTVQIPGCPSGQNITTRPDGITTWRGRWKTM